MIKKYMKNIKVIFIDIDGTLTNDKGIISEENKKALKELEENEIIPVLCSGRTRNSVQTRCEEIGIKSPFICSNGAEIFDIQSQEVIYSKRISENIVKHIWDFCQKRNIDIMLRTSSNAYISKDWDIENWKYKKIESISKILNEKIVRIKFKVKNEKILKKLLIFLKFLPRIRGTTKEYKDGDIIIGICEKNINKGVAIKQYLKIMKINKKYSCVIGNELNDLPMFKKGKYKIAVGNAIEKLKRKADFVTLSNNENGVYFFINEKILRRK